MLSSRLSLLYLPKPHVLMARVLWRYFDGRSRDSP